jgi:hypothetical protein
MVAPIRIRPVTPRKVRLKPSQKKRLARKIAALSGKTLDRLAEETQREMKASKQS